MKLPPLLLSTLLNCQALAVEINVEHQSVGTENVADRMQITNNNVAGSFTDDSQHNSIIGNGNDIQSQFKACEGSSNDNAGSAVCCASKAGGACCASAAEAGHDGSTSTDCPDHMPFMKKFDMRARPAESHSSQVRFRLIRAMWVYNLSILSVLLVRFLHRAGRKDFEGASAEVPECEGPETESLCRCEGRDLECSVAEQDVQLHSVASAKGAVQTHSWSPVARACVVCLALILAIAAATFAFSPQPPFVHASTSQGLGLQSMHMKEQDVDSQYIADTMIIKKIDGKETSVQFGDHTLEFGQQYRFVWTMDELPNLPDPGTSAVFGTIHKLLASSGLEMYWDPDANSLILDHVSERMEGALANLSPNAKELQWGLGFNPGADCLTLGANINGHCLTAQSHGDGTSASHVHWDTCNSDARPQCWKLHHLSRTISNTATGECIGISSQFISVDNQHVQEACALANGAEVAVVAAAGVLTVAATGGLALLAGGVGLGAVALTMPKDPLTLSVVMTDCDSSWALSWDTREA